MSLVPLDFQKREEKNEAKIILKEYSLNKCKVSRN
jgi:hypothetical protein